MPQRVAGARRFSPWPTLTETDRLVAAMSPAPSWARVRQIDTLIRSLKGAGIWDKLDVLYMLAAHDEQASRLNWKNPAAYTALAVNAPTFVADRGWTGDGATSRLRTQYTPSTNGVNLVRDSASIWVWSRTESLSSSNDVGNVSDPALRVTTRNAGGNTAITVNDGTLSSLVQISSVGLIGASRAASGTKNGWRNGIQVGSSASVASTGLTAEEQWICGANASHFSARQLSFAAWAASLAGLEPQFYSAVLQYMQSVGAA